ncbi:hypothetical protein CASFOL_007401 [Castilleja foliolosa]|uniref:Myb-like domain-containing protein n=1 Tax=Castilleja foliolosa TaxID=1961234 RepID=A0ABD3E956_9LAMI
MYNSPENVTFIHHPFMSLPSPPPPSPPPSGGGADAAAEFPIRNEKLSQWSYDETRDFIEIRAQLECNFNTTRRNKCLWEMVVNRMRDKGYRRTVVQCKWKWKNLISKYKASDTDNCRQFRFFNELHALFTSRDNRMQQAQLISEDENKAQTGLATDGMPTLKIGQKTEPSVKNILQTPNESVVASLQEMLGNFTEQQKRIDMLWEETTGRWAQDIEICERGWNERMKELEKADDLMEQAWREKEEQRISRDETRAEKMDALLTTLVNNLTGEENR